MKEQHGAEKSTRKAARSARMAWRRWKRRMLEPPRTEEDRERRRMLVERYYERPLVLLVLILAPLFERGSRDR